MKNDMPMVYEQHARCILLNQIVLFLEKLVPKYICLKYNNFIYISYFII